jgi:hypothetical protein
MKIRFLTSIVDPAFAFFRGQQIELGALVPPFDRFLKDKVIAIEPEERETATMLVPEGAVLVRKARRRPE